MLKMNKAARQARVWSAVAANLARTAYYALRSWPILAGCWKWLEDWWA